MISALSNTSILKLNSSNHREDRMTTYTLYSYGQHHLRQPLGPAESQSPCHPSLTSQRPCAHVQDSSSTRKPTFCPLALHPFKHFESPDLVRVLTPSGTLIQRGTELWYTLESFDTQLSFYAGRLRPKPGTPLFGQDPQVEGSAMISCDLLQQGHQIVDVAVGGGQGQPSLALFSNGELKVLRYISGSGERIKSKKGCFVFDKLNKDEVQAFNSVGVQADSHNIVGLTQTLGPGPVTISLKNGDVIELPWKDMEKAKQISGHNKQLAKKVVELAAGYGATVARTDDGEVWFWRVGQSAVQVKMADGQTAVAIRAGGKLGLALTKDGHVWAWRLTHADFGEQDPIVTGAGTNWIATEEGVVKAGRVELGGIEVVDASVGAAHLAVKTADNRWYTAGDGRYGQLGLGEKLFDIDDNATVERGDEHVSVLTPLNVEGLGHGKVETVVCGSGMTWVVTVDER